MEKASVPPNLRADCTQCQQGLPHTHQPRTLGTGTPYSVCTKCGAHVLAGTQHWCNYPSPAPQRDYAAERQQFNLERIATALERIADRLDKEGHQS